MRGLLACPFCRELFAPDEARVCPNCEVGLVPMNQLPPSHEAQMEAAALEASLPVDPPEDQPLGWLFLGRGRGALAVTGVLGFGCFFAPWVQLTLPDAISLSGMELAKGGVAWLWGGAVGWFILVALVVSRQTINELRGVRVVSATLALMTLAETGLLLLKPPAGNQFFDHELSYAYGLYLSLGLSVLGALLGARLGGSQEDLRDLPTQVKPPTRYPGETVH